MHSLNFPSYQIKTRQEKGKDSIFDVVRKKWLPLLPEEWVRQHVVHYLIEDKGVPAGLIGVEKGFQFQGMTRRADIIIHNRLGEAVLLVECKAPEVCIDQSVFDQVARYNLVIRARYLFVTNGLQHYCCEIDWSNQKYVFLEAIPDYNLL